MPTSHWNFSFFSQSVIGAMIVLNPFIIICRRLQAHEHFLYLEYFGAQPFYNSLNFLRIRNSLRRHNKSQEYNSISHEDTHL